MFSTLVFDSKVSFKADTGCENVARMMELYKYRYSRRYESRELRWHNLGRSIRCLNYVLAYFYLLEYCSNVEYLEL